MYYSYFSEGQNFVYLIVTATNLNLNLNANIISNIGNIGSINNITNHHNISRYDTEINNFTNTFSNTNGDLSLLGSLNCNRRGSSSSNNSDNIDNEGSVVSNRSFVSWHSDQSVASGDLSPEGSRSGDGTRSGVNKWGMPFGVNFNRQKNVSFPASSGSPDEYVAGGKIVDISALPDSTVFNSKLTSNRKYSSSSIQSFASGRSSGQSTYTANSEETMFGCSEILLEGYIWRYTLPARLHTADQTGQNEDLGPKSRMDLGPKSRMDLGLRPRASTQDYISNSNYETTPPRPNNDSTCSTYDIRLVSNAARATRIAQTNLSSSSPDFFATSVSTEYVPTTISPINYSDHDNDSIGRVRNSSFPSDLFSQPTDFYDLNLNLNLSGTPILNRNLKIKSSSPTSKSPKNDKNSSDRNPSTCNT